MKYITVGLLLIVCFFGGMTYGSVETNHALENEKVEVKEETMQMEPFTEEETVTENTPDISEDVPLIHQAAGLFEKFILNIYSAILEALYKTADLFF